jgi:hypothetical protein
MSIKRQEELKPGSRSSVQLNTSFAHTIEWNSKPQYELLCNVT